ncbi:MAG TPA: fibronectin type III domain-containing protein [Steroidobacteraceae bacterium]|jgi:hypothetical protein
MLGFWSSVRLSAWIVVSIPLLLVGCGSQDTPASSASQPQATAISRPASQSAPEGTSDPTPAPSPAPAPLPSPSTSNVTLSWTAPTQNTDGSALTDLHGFKIYYGTDATQLTNAVALPFGLATYVIDNLPVGATYYFAVTAVTANGAESALSTVVSQTIS